MQKLLQYLKDVRAEMLKVSWPTRNELVSATVLVIVLSLVIALYVYGCDKALDFVLSFFYRAIM